MKNILVSGGTGYIGSHTVLNLLIKGYRVTILDSNLNSSPKVINRINLIIKDIKPKASENLAFIKGDVRDFSLLDNIFLKAKEAHNNFDAVIHFAGLKSVANSKKNPIDYWDINMFGTINLMKIMDKYSCNKLIFSSSATVYGEVNKPPFKENYHLYPVNPYAKNKACIENFLYDVYKSNMAKWNISCLRYFNPIGAHSSGLIGENPLGNPNNIFPLILRACSRNEEINVFGNDWPTPDGTCIRDYIHIEDLAEGHIKTLESNSLKGFDCINLGTGKGTSVLELLKNFENVNNIKLKYKFDDRRQGDTAILIADNSKALSKLNWAPSRNLSDMCKDGYRWITKNPNGYDS